MKRNNFYILLGLSLDPPEADPDKIEAAIKKKQAEWSKLRNHPTRGIQAKQLIGFIPEIRKIMLDPDLRSKEAASALNLIAKQKRSKFETIDRHLSIFASKGDITSPEIQKLVKIHSVETDDILKWMLKKEKEKQTSSAPETKRIKRKALPQDQKLEQIVNSLTIRMRKGYILQKEIQYLSKTYNIDQNEIIKNIPFPVLEKEGPTADSLLKPIDATILKTVENNLKVVGKETLYDFLELPAGSDLEKLRTRAEKMQQELQGVSKKDAAVTAGSILAGHCKTIFKQQETRISYDIARARSFLNQLNSDIDIAEFQGVIRSEYTEAIIQNAAEFGMSEEEAAEYIEEYCSKKNWKVKSKKKTRRMMAATAIGFASVILLIGATLFIVTSLKNKKLAQEFDQVLATVTTQKKLEDKKVTLQNYIKTHEKNQYTVTAQQKITFLDTQIRKRNAQDKKDYQAAVKDASQAMVEKQFEKAESLYKQYLKKHPDGVHVKEIRTLAARIPGLIDERDFQAIGSLPETDFRKRLEAAMHYLETHKNGKFRADVAGTISQLDDPYAKTLRNEIAGLEKQNNWQACIALCDQYIAYFPKGKHLNQFKGEQYFYTKQLEKQTLLQELAQKVAKKQGNPDAVVKIYEEFLTKNPNSPIKYEVKKQLALIQKKSKK